MYAAGYYANDNLVWWRHTRQLKDMCAPTSGEDYNPRGSKAAHKERAARAVFNCLAYFDNPNM